MFTVLAIIIAIILVFSFIAGIGSTIASIFFNAARFLFGGFFRMIGWIINRGMNTIIIICAISVILSLWYIFTHIGSPI